MGPFNEDPATMMQTIDHLVEFDADPDCFVLLAHDSTLFETIDLLPGNIDLWKSQGCEASEQVEIPHGLRSMNLHSLKRVRGNDFKLAEIVLCSSLVSQAIYCDLRYYQHQ